MGFTFCAVVMLCKILLALPYRSIMSQCLDFDALSAISLFGAPLRECAMTAKFLHVTPFYVSFVGLFFVCFFLFEGLIFAYVWSL